MGSCGVVAVSSAGALGLVDVPGVGEAGVCAFGALKRFEPPLEEVGRLAKGFEASLVPDCWAGVSCTACDLDGVDASWALFDPNDWNEKPELALGCAVNNPAFAGSLSAVFAGCGVLKPLNRFVLGAVGAWNIGVLAGFSISLGAALF